MANFIEMRIEWCQVLQGKPTQLRIKFDSLLMKMISIAND